MRLFPTFRRLAPTGIAVVLFAGGPTVVSATEFFGADDGNYLIQNDLFPRNPSDTPPNKMAVGDFDGNGRDDVALFLSQTSEKGEVVLILNPTTGQTIFSKANTMRISVPPVVGDLKMVDLNGDEKKDLVIGEPASGAPYKGQIDIILGKENPPQTLNLLESAPDLRIVGKNDGELGHSLASGDFVGDEVDDLFVGAPGNGGGCFLIGDRNLKLGIINLATEESLPWVIGPGLGWEIERGDFNGDRKVDLVLSAPNVGIIYILFGKPMFPSLWNLASSSADVKISGPSLMHPLSGIVAVESGDLTKDGKDELIVGWAGINSTPIEYVRALFAIDGGALSISGSTRTVGTPPTEPTLIPGSGTGSRLVNVAGVRVSDVDGDGANDFIFSEMTFTTISKVFTLFSSDVGPGLESFAYTGSENWSLQWTVNGSLFGEGNFNGDTPSDLVIYDSASLGPPYGVLRFLYGFQPLKNPSLQIRERTPTRPKVTLDLHVDGFPTEVFLTGDVAENDRGRWLPFQSALPIDLSSGKGTKQVSGVFRNAVGRQSKEVADTVSLDVGQQGTETFTNVFSPGGQARVYCHVTSPGHVKAEVFSREGTSIVQLLEDDFAPGVWPVVWNGKNDAGQAVVPGMYVLVVTVNGQPEIHKIIVQE